MRTADEIDILEMRIRGLERELRDMRETLRDKFATAALDGLLAHEHGADAPFELLAQWAYQIADEMLIARKPKPSPPK